MSGKFSREKGRRNEQQLVLYLAKLGFKAERILRQYQEAGQPDVKATKDGNTITFEMKARRESYKSIYSLYESDKDERGDLCFTDKQFGTCVAMNRDLRELFKPSSEFRFINLEMFPPVPIKNLKVYNRIIGLKEIKQTADYLCIKDNNQYRLFLRFW